MKRMVTFVLALGALAFLAGCAGGLQKLPDGTYFGVTTANDSIDRSFSYAARYKETGAPTRDGKPSLVQVGEEHIAVSPTVAGQVVIGVAAGAVPAIINGITARSVADKTSCGGKGCPGMTFYNQPLAVSGANAQNANVNHNALGINGQPSVCSGQDCGFAK